MQQWIKLASETTGEEQNVLLPAIYDIVWGGLSFLIVLVLFAKFVMPTMREITAARTEKIEGGLARAEQSQVEASELLAKYRAALADANKEASDIRAAASAERLAIIDDAKKAAATAAAAVNAQAQSALESDRTRVATELRRDLGLVATDLASRIVGEVLTDDARAQAVVERFISDLEKSAGR
jgi:F-type H+-transporting ATPase subunit b